MIQRKGLLALMNPFDLKEALLAKHAQHVVLVHFPIALFLAGVGFDLLAQRWNKTNFAAVAYYNILAAALSTPFVVATGLLAWKFQLDSEKLKGVLLLHLLFGCTGAALICLVSFLHIRARRSPGISLPRYRLPIELVAAVIIAATGHLGGFLTGVNGVG